MPVRPNKPCSVPNCPNLTGGSYCTEHQHLKPKRVHEKKSPEHNKRYGRRWRKIRRPYIDQNPLCEECQLRGVLTPAQEVHHIIPLSQGGENTQDNFMALCKSCHSRITGKQTGGGR